MASWCWVSIWTITWIFENWSFSSSPTLHLISESKHQRVFACFSKTGVPAESFVSLILDILSWEAVHMVFVWMGNPKWLFMVGEHSSKYIFSVMCFKSKLLLIFPVFECDSLDYSRPTCLRTQEWKTGVVLKFHIYLIHHRNALPFHWEIDIFIPHKNI